ncbi:MAG TPA: hypothetical protein DDX98_03310 [Bacteroidales bacterium]|jgi:transcription elongation factor Elf1|nr:hypothetical protein [Bacteroidales bacterium]
MSPHKIRFHCINCGKSLIAERNDGFFLKTRGIVFSDNPSECGNVICKKCGKLSPIPIFIFNNIA